MDKFWKFFSTYVVPVIVIGTVVVCCVLFLLENLPYDNSVLDVDISQKKVVVNNDLLMSDSLGKVISADNYKNGTIGYVDIEIESKADGKVKYEIVINKEAALSEVDSRFVKVYVTDFNDKALSGYTGTQVPTYFDLKVAETDPSAKVVYSGSLKDRGEAKIRVRMWVADTLEITPESKIFSSIFSVNVK